MSRPYERGKHGKPNKPNSQGAHSAGTTKSSSRNQTGKKSKDKPTKSEDDEVTLKESLRICWDKRLVKNLKIIESSRQVDKEKYYKCILEHVSDIAELLEQKDDAVVSIAETPSDKETNTFKEEADRLKKNLSAIENQCEQLWQHVREDIHSLPKDSAEKVRIAEQQFNNLKQNLCDVQQQNDEQEKQIIELKNEIRKLQETYKSPEGKENERHVSTGDLEETRDVKTQLMIVTEECDKLKAKLSRFEKDNNECQELERKLQSNLNEKVKGLEQKIQQKQKEIDLLEDNPKQMLSDKDYEMREDSSKQRRQDKMYVEIEKLRARCSTLEDRQKELEKEKTTLRKTEELNAQREKDWEEKTKQLKAKQKELLDAKNETNDLKRQIAQCESEKKAMKDTNKQLEQELNDAKVSELRNLTSTEKAGDEVKTLRQQVKDLTERLATEMNSKISSDESALENISIGNRPMKLADEYQHFCSHVWLDAKESLDDEGRFGQKESLVSLQKILTISHQMCSEEAKGANDILLQLLEVPVKRSYTVRKDVTQAIPGSTRALFNAFGDHLRREADTVDLTGLSEEVVGKIPKNFQNVKKKAFETYIEEAVRLSWKMVIQRPAMTFSVEGEGKKWEGEQTQELYWGSHPDKKGAKVMYYVHPKLKHGDKLMVKGRVLVE